jgi:glycosyltransferase involved in cell wall biosynthesis
MPDLTVLIPCKNEERHIRGCIESARPIAGEILVADSGSTDRTLATVDEVGGCRLIEREFIGYADFKNWAIPQAAHEWILLLDADERVSPELALEIQGLFSGDLPDVDGFLMRRRNLFMSQEILHSHWGRDRVLRLFRRDVCRYAERPVHEAIVCNPERTAELAHHLLHYTGSSYDDYLRKAKDYSRLWADDAWKRGRRSSVLDMLFAPPLRFLSQYVLRGGFLDGKAGLQVCVLNAYFGTFLKRARLWELEHADRQRETERDSDLRPTTKGAKRPDEPAATAWQTLRTSRPDQPANAA